MIRLANPARVRIAAPVRMGLEAKAESGKDFLLEDMAAPQAENWYNL